MSLKLYVENNEIYPSYKYVDDGIPPIGYSETSSMMNWDLAAFPYIITEGILDFHSYRDEIEQIYNNIINPTEEDKKIASKWFVIDKLIRDTVHTEEEQRINARWVYEKSNHDINSVSEAFVDFVSKGESSVIKEAINFTENSTSNYINSYINVSGTINLKPTFGVDSIHHVIVNGNAVIDLSLLQENTNIYLMIEQDSTGNYTVVLPTFDNLDVQPTVTRNASKMDNLLIMKMSNKVCLHGYIRPTDIF